jgi:hypothetical protein
MRRSWASSASSRRAANHSGFTSRPAVVVGKVVWRPQPITVRMNGQACKHVAA